MQKVIEGRLYDTDTAEKLGSYDYGTKQDFEHVSETLYRKQNGQYFLHGEGGPCTQYGVAIDGCSSISGETIIPFSEQEAKCWAEEHMTASEYFQAFGAVEE